MNAQSSAKRRSLIEVSLIFVIACRRRRLKSLPLHLYVIGMPDELSLNASVSIAENTRLNSAEARTHPCFTLSLGKALNCHHH